MAIRFLGAALPATGDPVIAKTATQTKNADAVMADDAELFAPTIAGGLYEVEARIFYALGGAETINITVAHSTALVEQQWQTATVNPSSVANTFNAGTGGPGVQISQTGGPGIGSAIFRGRIVVNTSGVCSVRWAQAAAVAANTRVISGSTLRLRKLA